VGLVCTSLCCGIHHEPTPVVSTPPDSNSPVLLRNSQYSRVLFLFLKLIYYLLRLSLHSCKLNCCLDRVASFQSTHRSPSCSSTNWLMFQSLVFHICVSMSRPSIVDCGTLLRSSMGLVPNLLFQSHALVSTGLSCLLALSLVEAMPL
jgi:hypothetical protein